MKSFYDEVQATALTHHPHADAESLDAFSSMIDTMPQAVFCKTLDGTYTSCNSSWAELLGLTVSDIIGHTDFDLQSPSVARRMFQWDSELLAGNTHQVIEASLALGSREERNFIFHRGLLTDAQGKTGGIVATVMDLTRSRKEEQERSAVLVMAATAEMAIQTIEGMIDPVIILDAEGKVERINRGYAELFGLEKTPSGLSLHAIFSDITPEEARSLLRRCNDQGRLRDIAARVLASNGQAIPVLVNISTLRDSQKTLDGFVVAIRDVSSLVNANEKLDAMLREQKQAENLQRALYSISEAAYFARDQKNLFSIVHRIVARLVPAENLFIALFDPVDGGLACPYYVDESGEVSDERAQKAALSDGLVSYLLSGGSSLLLKAREIELLRLQGTLPPVSAPTPGEWLGVPLRNGEGSLIGALVAQTFRRGGSYSEADRKILNFVSNQIAMAIERKQGEEALREKNAQLKALTDGTILALVKAVELRDPYTAGHQQRVSKLAAALAREIGLSSDRIEATRIAGLLHDVGKISVPSELLSKPGHLSNLELDLIREHPVTSSSILSTIDFPWPIASFVLQHHEKMDGSGYPNALKGNEISLESRILCVADVVDAMVSHRPYRPSRGLGSALEEISDTSKSLYDTEVTAACVKLFKTGAFSFEDAVPAILTT